MAESGKGIVNPHNPEFITKKPWYLTGDNDHGSGNNNDSAGLDHQQVQTGTDGKRALTLTAAEELLAQQRRQENKSSLLQLFEMGQWVEALKKGKKPYRICQIVKIHPSSSSSSKSYDLQYEDGSIEKRIKVMGSNGNNNNNSSPRIRATGAGNRAFLMNNNANELVVQATYDSKRDKYHGFDRDTHNGLLKQKFEEKLALRRKMRDDNEDGPTTTAKSSSSSTTTAAGGGGTNQGKGNNKGGGEAKKKKTNQGGAGSDSDFDDSDVESGDDDESDDEFVQRDQDAKVMTTRLARQGGVGGAQMKVTARNLRIREDTAKYLRNLDVSSAYYDPKSRSMRDNPNPEATDSDFVGDNLTRISGDAVGLAQQQLFAWEATARGVQEVHPQANPSQAELLKKQFQTQARDLQDQRKRAVLDKYGGEEYLDSSQPNSNNANSDGAMATEHEEAERKLRFGVSTNAEEYSREGRLGGGGGGGMNNNKKRPKQKAIPCKYEEDVYMNGHTSVFGSYFHRGAFTWGYHDDHSLMKQSYCTGMKGRIANDEANEQQYGTGRAGTAELAQARTLLVKPAAERSKQQPVAKSKLFGEADRDAQLDAVKVQEAATKLSEEERKAAKRKYNSMEQVEMTEEMMEAYRLQKGKKSDPMAKLGSDDILDYK